MKAVIQRVTKASVTIEGQQVAKINSGLLVLLGIVNDDTQDDIKWLSNKITNLRVFSDDNLRLIYYRTISHNGDSRSPRKNRQRFDCF